MYNINIVVLVVSLLPGASLHPSVRYFTARPSTYPTVVYPQTLLYQPTYVSILVRMYTTTLWATFARKNIVGAAGSYVRNKAISGQTPYSTHCTYLVGHFHFLVGPPACTWVYNEEGVRIRTREVTYYRPCDTRTYALSSM